MKIYPQRINTDAADVALQPTECRSKTNLRSGLVSGGNALSNENLQSTVLVPSSYYESGDMVIGACEDISNDSILFHVYNPDATKNKILRYFPFDNDSVELILKSDLLGYKEDWKITQNNVISGLFYFTFGYFNSFLNNDFNPPRKINIAKAKKFTDAYNSSARWDFQSVAEASEITTDPAVQGMNYTAYISTSALSFAIGDKVVAWSIDGINRVKTTSGYGVVKTFGFHAGKNFVVTDRPWQETSTAETVRAGYILPYATDQYFGIDWQVLDAVKYPPFKSPTVSYTTDTSFKSNLLRGSMPQFIYRWIYDDNEKSVWSPISDIPLPTIPENPCGTFNEQIISDNAISIWMGTGSMEVKTIELAARFGNIGNWFIIKRFDKLESTSSDISIVYYFYNNEVHESLDNDKDSQEFRQQDSVPLIAACQELIEKNRLSYSNYYEGLNPVAIDVALSYNKSKVQTGTIGGISETNYTSAILARKGSTSDLYYVARLDWTDPDISLEIGYTYAILIDNYPFSYGDPHGYLEDPGDSPMPGVPPTTWIKAGIPLPWDGKYKNGIAAMTYDGVISDSDFYDGLVEQLRKIHGDTGILAYRAEGNGSSDTNTYTGSLGTFGVYLTVDSPSGVVNPHIAFILEPAKFISGSGITSCESCATLRTRIVKFKDSTKYGTFKSGATHSFCLFYKDRGGRIGAANISDESSIYVPSQNHGAVENDKDINRFTINYSISHQPPDYADYYSWGYSKNTSIGYFLFASLSGVGQSRVSNSIYIDIIPYMESSREAMLSFSLRNYEWEKGDRVRFVFYKTETNNDWTLIESELDFEITGVYNASDIGDAYMRDKNNEFIVNKDGNKVEDFRKLRLTVTSFAYSLYNIATDNCVVEIYRPLKIQSQKIYYQFGGWKQIINPHTATRYHEGDAQDQTATLPATGTFEYGDAYLLFRLMGNIFPAESRGYSDFYESENINIGNPNVVNPQMSFKNYISYQRYSQLYIENSLTNGLSTFYGSDFDVLPTKYEKIYSAKENGEVLRVMQKNKCTSIYIGKGEMKQPTIGDEGVVAISPSVIGSKRYHVEAYGTVFPESVVNTSNYTYFFDIYNSVYVRWSTNGLQQICYKDATTGWDYGVGVYFRNKSTALLESGINNVKVYAVYEKEYECLTVTFIDSVTPINNETIVFHEPTNSWIMKCSFLPEYYGTNKKVLVMAKDGQLWKANAGTDRNTFFGVPYKSEIEVVGHEESDKNYVFNDIELVTNSDKWEAPNTGDVQVNLINGTMKSRLKRGRFTNREGVMVATFGKDMTTSGVELQQDLITGRELRGHAVTVRLENDSTDEVILTAININSTESE